MTQEPQRKTTIETISELMQIKIVMAIAIEENSGEVKRKQMIEIAGLKATAWIKALSAISKATAVDDIAHLKAISVLHEIQEAIGQVLSEIESEGSTNGDPDQS